jgi:hypothetical protein
VRENHGLKPLHVVTRLTHSEATIVTADFGRRSK